MDFRKRIELKINIGSHDYEDLEYQMDRIVQDLKLYKDINEDQTINIASGAGYSIEGSIDTKWDKEKSTKALMEWFDK